MKLFAFKPMSHGQFSTFIMAIDEQDALNKARSYIENWLKRNPDDDYFFEGFPHDYTCEICLDGIGINFND